MADETGLIQQAKEIWNQYKQSIAALLGLPVPDVKFVVKELGQGVVASTDSENGIVYLDPSWNPDDPGAIVHEGVHLVQNISGGDTPSKYIEAIADAVRLKLGLTPPGWEPTPLAARLAELKPAQLKVVSQNMQSEDFRPGLLKRIESGDVNASTFDLSPLAQAVAGPMAQVANSVLTGGPLSTGGGGTVTWTNPMNGVTVTGKDTNGDGIPDLDAKGNPLDWAKIFASQTAQTPAAAYSMEVYSLGLSPKDAGIKDLIQKAVSNQWTTAQFDQRLYRSDEFSAAFPGIFNQDGSLKMSPTAYQQQADLYSQYAANAGINLTPKTTAYLFRNDVSPSEFLDRARADQQLRDNPALYQAYNEQLRQEGLAPLDKPGMLKFLLGQGNKEYYQVWNRANTRYEAEQAGIKFVKHAESKGYSTLGQGVVNKVAGLGLSADAQHQAFQNIAQQLLTVLPLSRIQSYGLTKKQITEASFGGPKQAEVIQKMQHIMDQDQAFYQDRATTQVGVTQTGPAIVGGAGSRAAQ